MNANLFWIPASTAGRIAIMPRPRGGDWLEEEVRAWRLATVDVVVSLLTPEEIGEFELADEEAACTAQGIQFLAFPIADRSVPGSMSAFTKTLQGLSDLLNEGKNIAIHCRQGIGRAALVAICLLCLGGLDPDQAMKQVSEARGCPVPETPEQKRWIVDFARNAVAAIR